ncbi:MAG: helix-turn-helix domain-containing protein [Micrococcales bacterium]|nr:helix-turn-helix domain-containing protein [Micrococcales bacterium]
MTADMGRRLLTVEEVADELGVSRRTVYSLMQGRLGYVQLSPQVRRVTRNQLDAFIEAGTHEPIAPEPPEIPSPGAPEEEQSAGVTFIGDGLTGRSRAAGGWAP